jgi:hypothetical protein
MRVSSPSTPSGSHSGAEIFNSAKPVKKARKMMLSEHRKMIKPVRL